jgi:NAD(P)-dependent dehydrogenase (short-subunit alcohol dehydrogenase family)
VEQFGRIDIVINNAGNQRNVKFGALSEEDIDAVYAVHVKGAFFVTQPAYRLMVAQNYGRIVLVSSQSGMFGNPIRSNYGSAKTAMVGLMNVMAQELPKGVAVNCLFPNAVGGRLGGAPGDIRPDAEFLAAAARRVPHYIDGMQPAFVAALVTYLSSEQCSTSQNMYSVLGGKYSRIFIGLTEGWYQGGKTVPTPEEILAHLPQIDDRTHYALPLSGLDEMDTVLALQAKLRNLDK